MRTVTFLLFSRSYYLLASSAKRHDLAIEKDNSVNFQAVHELDENALCFVEKTEKEVNFLSQSRVNPSLLQINNDARNPHFQHLFGDLAPNFKFER